VGSVVTVYYYKMFSCSLIFEISYDDFMIIDQLMIFLKSVPDSDSEKV